MLAQEIFVIEKKPTLTDKEKARVAVISEKLATAQSLGLKAQVKAIKSELTSLQKGSLIATAPMSKAELLIWGAWLPTAYLDHPNEDIGEKKLSEYEFDRIPSPVLKIWKHHKDAKNFERFEIWTPEDARPDPILIGVNGNTRHLLARWGESDANLVSLDDIKHELVRRWKAGDWLKDSNEDVFERHHRGDIAFWFGLLSAVATFVATMGLMWFLDMTKAQAPFLALIALAGAVGLGVGIWKYRHKTEKLFNASPLMQAIVKDSFPERKLATAE